MMETILGMSVIWIAFLHMMVIRYSARAIVLQSEIDQLRTEWDLFNGVRIHSAQPADPHPGMP